MCFPVGYSGGKGLVCAMVLGPLAVAGVWRCRETGAVTAGLLGLVERQIGTRQQGLKVCFPGMHGRDAQADGHAQRTMIRGEGCVFDTLAQALGHGPGFGRYGGQAQDANSSPPIRARISCRRN